MKMDPSYNTAGDRHDGNHEQQLHLLSRTIISQRLEIQRLQKENDELMAISLSLPKKIRKALREAGTLPKRTLRSIIRRLKYHANSGAGKEAEAAAAAALKGFLNNSSDLYAEYVLSIPKLGPGCDTYVPDLASKYIELGEEDVKYIAFYLPQYHSFPENDSWWGKNFTEWTNVTKAVPLFPGHYQPRLAGDLGYYNLKDKDTIAEQMRLARKYGIYGFCIYYYWFDGRQLMPEPLDIILHNPDLNLPFCICWANENWTRRWDGKNSDILIEQTYSGDFALRFIRSVAGYFSDPRYIRRNNRPLLVIYNSNQIPDLKSVIQIWRDYCRAEGIGEIHISAVHFYPNRASLHAGFDDFIEFPPHLPYLYQDNSLLAHPQTVSPDFSGRVIDYRKLISKKYYLKSRPDDLVPGVTLAWDNTARRGNASMIFDNYSPDAFSKWLGDVTAFTKCKKDPGDRFVFINAWNEWAEGTYLEPDRKYGYAALQSVRNTILNSRASARRIIYVSHDSCVAGAQLLSINIIRVLTRVFHYQVFLILKDGGELRAQFEELACSTLCLSDGYSSEDFSQWIRQSDAKIAICNTIVSGDLTKTLAELGVSCISLIHEMRNVILERKAENHLRLVSEYAERVVFASAYVKKSTDTIYCVPDEKTVIRPQGLYMPNPYLRNKRTVQKQVFSEFSIARNKKLILGAGAADNYRKGIDLFIKTGLEVLKTRDDIVFMWAGTLTSETNSMIKKLIPDKLSEHFLFPGLRSDIMRLYTAASIFLLTSREDPFPSVVMEAMYSGLPVIASAGCGGYEEIINKDTGVLVDREDTRQMAGAILALCEDPDGLARLQQSAHRFAAENFKFVPYVAKLLELFGEAVPSVSVVIPNYNYAKYLPERIDSVLWQNYPLREIIILDDASSDNSLDILSQYEKKYPGLIRVVAGKERSGNVFRQWARGFGMAAGDFVWIAEADDSSEPGFLPAVMGKLIDDPEMSMCYSQSKKIDNNGNIKDLNYFLYTDDISETDWKRDYVLSAADELHRHLYIKNTIPNVSAVVFRNGDYREIFDRASEYSVAGDWSVYADILQKGGHIGYVAENLNLHRRHAGTVTSEVAKQRHFDEVVKMQERVMSDCDIQDRRKALLYREQLRRQFGLR